MKTGIVVNNYDPMFKNRCQIRISGIHTQKVCGQYVIIDDDLPWALPAPNPNSNGGTYSVPRVGARVYVDIKDAYNILYYGEVEIKGNVKDILYDHADDSEHIKVISFSEDYNDDGSKEYLATNLNDPDIKPYMFKELYFMRWPIEQKYGELKNQFMMEEFSGATSTPLNRNSSSISYCPTWPR